jgi:hypothetical protein
MSTASDQAYLAEQVAKQSQALAYWNRAAASGGAGGAVHAGSGFMPPVRVAAVSLASQFLSSCTLFLTCSHPLRRTL